MSHLLDRLARIQGTPLPPRYPKKGFSPENPEIPILEDYSVTPGKEFWKVFPKQRNWKSGTPFKLSVPVLEQWVEDAGATEELTTLLEDVKLDIENGADLRVKPDYTPTHSKNARSALDDGKYVTDTIASGLKKGIYAG